MSFLHCFAMVICTKVSRVSRLSIFESIRDFFPHSITARQKSARADGCVYRHAVGDADVALSVSERINGDEADQLLRRDVTQLARLAL